MEQTNKTVENQGTDDAAWVVMRVEASFAVPKGTRIGAAWDGRGCRLVLPDGRRVNPIIGLEVEKTPNAEDYHDIVRESDFEKEGFSLLDYRYPPLGGDEVEEGQGAPIEEDA